MNTFVFAFIIAGLFSLALAIVGSDVVTAINNLKKLLSKPKQEPIVYEHSWVTGIMLWGYKTDSPNGQLIGFDCDYGYMFALNGKCVPLDEYREKYSKDMSLPEPFTVNNSDEKHHFNSILV